MVVRKINFGNGYINVTEDTVSYYLGNSHQSIDRKCIGTIKSNKKTFLLKNSWTYSLRIVFFGVIALIFSLITSISFLTYVGIAICVYGFLAYLIFILFSMLGMHQISNFLIEIIFGVRGYEVMIENTCGGKNILFNIHKEDKNKVNSIEQYRLDKTIIEDKKDNPLEELEKLSELFNKGILTEEEFNAKKKILLNL
ncbi:hypothetical protein FLAVO9AF_120024 [Flavobacterium sp. 9AF]|uniref:SHOCT domain-containing protein n=1 Tax=Flavobacterium sp. 9AF TaxID=2653142 RepID=UPI0012F28A26|nr:SHOCT domain-containing protein [Flavobacterium sp. 9AF]VXB18730.1 hypothetical protein FLAVO9AF_120024 [Flavobacterium sp. 9AF]